MRKLFIVILALLFFGCVSKPSPIDELSSFPVWGMVYDRDGNPLQDVAVILYPFLDENANEINEGKEVQAKSDIDGRFVLPEIKTGAYTYLISLSGYEDQNNKILISRSTDVLHFVLTSKDYLLKMVEEALEKRSWLTAHQYLVRLEDIDEQDPIIKYVRVLWAILVPDGVMEHDVDWGLSQRLLRVKQVLLELKQLGYNIDPIVVLLSEVLATEQ
jgi:hypothetical protein